MRAHMDMDMYAASDQCWQRGASLPHIAYRAHHRPCVSAGHHHHSDAGYYGGGDYGGGYEGGGGGHDGGGGGFDGGDGGSFAADS